MLTQDRVESRMISSRLMMSAYALVDLDGGILTKLGTIGELKPAETGS